MLGASAATTRQSIAYAEIAAREGADGILLMPPTYVLKATRAELVAHFRKVGAAVPLPIIAYNSPRRAGIALSVDDLAAIVDVAPIVGLKESTRDFAHLSEVIRRLGERIAIMTGPASFVLPGIALGAACATGIAGDLTVAGVAVAKTPAGPVSILPGGPTMSVYRGTEKAEYPVGLMGGR